MSIRRHTLLLFFLCGWLPAVGLACALFAFREHDRKTHLQERTREEADQTAQRIHAALLTHERQIKLLAQDARVINYLDSRGVPPRDMVSGREMPALFGSPFGDYWAMNGGDVRGIYGFDPDRQPVFIAEVVPGEDGGFVTKRAQSIPQVTVDQTTWSTIGKGALFGIIGKGGIARYYLPVSGSKGWSLLVIDISIETLLREVLTGDDQKPEAGYRLVVDERGMLLNEFPSAIRYQPVNSIVPELSAITSDLSAHRPGSGLIFNRGLPYFEAHHPVGSLGLSVVLMRPQNGFGGRAWWFFLAALALTTILFLAFVRWHQLGVRRDQQAVQQIAQRAAAVAAGKLTQPIVVDASADLQTLAGNFNLMIEKLREQIAREAEARQFQSFLRLSATITHDLKNAIQALSLLVGNLEAHFNDPEFRSQAIQGLTRLTETLNALIARLSEPMRSLSGEMPRPQPTDLSSMLRRVLHATAEQDRAGHQLNAVLPDKLTVEIDAERIEKVFENLIINALQAMDKKAGTLTVSAVSDDQNCTISIADTGVGMTEEYIKEKLFRAFATTKPLGIGLGLYTCREVVRAHGGKIEAESEKGSGTTFRVMLPLRAQGFWTTLN